VQRTEGFLFELEALGRAGNSDRGVHLLHSYVPESGVGQRLLQHLRLTQAERARLAGQGRRQLGAAADDGYRNRKEAVALRCRVNHGGQPEWVGVECCGFHKSWTREACGDQPHRFYVDDTLLTQAALQEGMGVSILPCFMGDPDPALARYAEPQPEWDLGLWILLHPDLKRTARVLAFRNHMVQAIEAQSALFAGRKTRQP
jgi:DNA-binding transcriptional LysR family regulator